MKKRKGIFKNPARQVIFSKPGFFYSLGTSLHIFWEYFKGFLFIGNYARAVSFFGSARETLPNKYYEDCEEIASRLSNKDFAIITGGSGGIMRAANKGAWKVGGESVGINIKLPEEQLNNNFLNGSRNFSFFFSRKTILSCASEIYIFFPGGFGTLDELFEMLTLLQTKHSQPVYIFLYGKDFWSGIYEFACKKLRDEYKTISEEDVHLMKVVDSVDDLEYQIDNLIIKEERVCFIGPQKEMKKTN